MESDHPADLWEEGSGSGVGIVAWRGAWAQAPWGPRAAQPAAAGGSWRWRQAVGSGCGDQVSCSDFILGFLGRARGCSAGQWCDAVLVSKFSHSAGWVKTGSAWGRGKLGDWLGGCGGPGRRRGVAGGQSQQPVGCDVAPRAPSLLGSRLKVIALNASAAPVCHGRWHARSSGA